MDHRDHFATRCIHAGEAPDPATGAHGVPLYANATYAFRSFEQVERMWDGELPHFTYQPRGNPTVRCFELKLADLEGAEDAVAGASGMAVIGATLASLCLPAGHLVASNEIYDLARTFVEQELPAAGAAVTFVDPRDPAAVDAAIRPETKAIYAEPFSNPLLHVADLPGLAAVAHRHGIPLVIDNTFLSPALLRPIEHGADLVLHSATKFLSGHGQVVGGVVAGRREHISAIKEKLVRQGGAMPPFTAWVLLAGVKTLPLRVERHSRNAAAVARLLAGHPAVASVRYPGLADHPGHRLAAGLVGAGDGRFGGMVAFTLAGGRDAVAAFVDALRIPTLAVSLGDCGTLVWPWGRAGLVRLSVGLEDVADLCTDIAAALDAAVAATTMTTQR